MKSKRHAVVRVDWPPGFAPSAPTEIPPSLVFIPRAALGEAADIAVRLNAQEMTKAADQPRGWFLAVKTMERRRTMPESSAIVEASASMPSESSPPPPYQD